MRESKGPSYLTPGGDILVKGIGLTVYRLQGATVPFPTKRRVTATKEKRSEQCLGTPVEMKSTCRLGINQAGFLEVVALQTDLGPSWEGGACQ